MTNALSLRPGDRVPDFALPGLDGKMRKFIWSFTGDPVALLVVEDLGLLDGPAFATLRTACQSASVGLVVVTGTPITAAAAAWAKLGAEAESPLLLSDAERKFVPALLAQGGGVGLGPSGVLRLRVIVLDPNQRVATTFDTRALAAAADALGATAQSVRADTGADQLLRTAKIGRAHV